MSTVNLARLVSLAHRRNLDAQARVADLGDEVAVLHDQRARVAGYALDYRLVAAGPQARPGSDGLRVRHAMASGLDDRLTRLDEELDRKRAQLDAAREEQRRERGSESALGAMLERAERGEVRRAARIEDDAFDAALALRLRARHLLVRTGRTAALATASAARAETTRRLAVAPTSAPTPISRRSPASTPEPADGATVGRLDAAFRIAA